MVKLLLIFVVVTDEKRKKKIMSEQLGRNTTGEPTMSGWDRLNRGRRLLEEAEHNKYQRRIIEKERLQKTNELQQVVDGVQRERDAQLLELALVVVKQPRARFMAKILSRSS